MKSARGHMTLLAIACATAVVTVSVFFYMHSMIGGAVARISVDMNKIHASKIDQGRRQSLEQAYQSTVAKWARLEGFFIPSDLLVSFIESLEALGPQTGTTVSVASVDSDITDDSAPGTTGTIHASVGVAGTWSSAMRALSLAESMPYKVTISNVRLSGSSSSGGKDGAIKSNWQLGFDIQAAVVVPLETSPAPATTTTPGRSRSPTSGSGPKPASKPAEII